MRYRVECFRRSQKQLAKLLRLPMEQLEALQGLGWGVVEIAAILIKSKDTYR